MNTRTISAAAVEPRWPAVAVIVFATVLITALPGRYQMTPPWFPWTACTIVIAPRLVVTRMPTSVRWHRIERAIVFAFFCIVWATMVLAIGWLVVDMVKNTHLYGSLTLLESAAVIWIVNIILFALLYWQIDCAGPEARASGAIGAADFRFGEAEDAETEEGSAPWQAGFVDYLFLAFAISTSFTPPDYARPASSRAKLLAMVQASTSLVTLVLIASRAVATLS